MSEKTIKKIYTPNIISVSPETPVLEAVSIMEKNSISCLVIVVDRKPAGIFTERDFIRAMYRNANLEGFAIRELMNSPVIMTSVSAGVYEAYDLIETNRIRHLVVVDTKGNLAGIVTQTDIIKHLGVESFIEIKNISRIMTKDPFTIKKGSSVSSAISSMVENSISCIIVEEDRHPVGILTERDVVRLYGERIDLEATPVEEKMSSPVQTISLENPVHKAVGVMNHRKIRRLVVVDSRKRISGIVTQSDIIRRVEERYIKFLKEIIQKREQLLQEKKRILSEKLILDNILNSPIDTAIVALDSHLSVLYSNPMAEKMFAGKTDGGLKGELKEFPLLSEEALATVRRDGTHKFVVEHEKDGGVRFIESTVSGIRDSDERTFGYVLMARDITEQKKMEEESLKANKLESISVLAGGIAHDFNNLLAGILNCISIAKSFMDPADKAFESLTMAEKASHVAKDLTHQLSAFAMISQPVKKIEDLAELLEESACFIPSDFNVKCKVSVPRDLWPVDIDEGQMVRVFNNLTINAAEAMPEGGVIGITARNIAISTKDSLPLKTGEYVVVSVKDEGFGIPREYLSKIFDPYFSTKQRGRVKGAGLGLAICYSIIKNHDGYIAVESEPGAGTTFHVYLPASRNKDIGGI